MYNQTGIFDSDLDFKFRFRWDIRDINNEAEITFRLRPSITFSYPLPWTIQNRPIKTFLMNEVSFDTNVDTFNRHRVSTGLTFPLTAFMKWTLGYQIESNRIRSGKWDADSIIMTGFDFRF